MNSHLRPAILKSTPSLTSYPLLITFWRPPERVILPRVGKSAPGSPRRGESHQVRWSHLPPQPGPRQHSQQRITSLPERLAPCLSRLEVSLYLLRSQSKASSTPTPASMENLPTLHILQRLQWTYALANPTFTSGTASLFVERCLVDIIRERCLCSP
jgi:hypothetical protein